MAPIFNEPCFLLASSSPAPQTQLTTGEFDWNPQVQSYIVGSFFMGYVVTQIPAGRMAERFGSKRLLSASILLASIFTLLCPIAARFHYLAFIGCRILIGLSEVNIQLSADYLLLFTENV